jgi:molybdopterin-guanine dinucleotide biosynthesis protein
VVQLNRLIERLCDAGIDFVIVGGFAGVLRAIAEKKK